MKKIFTIGIPLLILIGSILIYIYISRPSQVIRYKGVEDITITENIYSGIALIEKKKSFKKEGIPYIQFGINIIEQQEYFKTLFDDDTYIFTEEQLNSLIGEENNAFDYEEYRIGYHAFIMKDDNIISNKVIDFADKYQLSVSPFHISHNLYCIDYENFSDVESAYVRYNKDKQSLVLYLDMKSRANFLGDKPFTEEEKEQHKEMVDNMCLDILRMIDGKEPELTWKTR